MVCKNRLLKRSLNRHERLKITHVKMRQFSTRSGEGEKALNFIDLWGLECTASDNNTVKRTETDKAIDIFVKGEIGNTGNKFEMNFDLIKTSNKVDAVLNMDHNFYFNENEIPCPIIATVKATIIFSDENGNYQKRSDSLSTFRSDSNTDTSYTQSTSAVVVAGKKEKIEVAYAEYAFYANGGLLEDGKVFLWP